MALGGALAATIAWQGISIPVPFGAPIKVVDGMKDTGFGKDLNAWYERQKQLRRVKASGGVVVEAVTGAIEAREDPECELLSREWAKAMRRGDMAAATRFITQANTKGCLWAKQVSP